MHAILLLYAKLIALHIHYMESYIIPANFCELIVSESSH